MIYAHHDAPDFLRLLESTLQPRRVAFSRAALIAFVESAWPLVEVEPDVDFWCEPFLEGVDLMTPA
jgi:hypothetical protein